MLNSSTPLVQSKSRSIRDLAVGGRRDRELVAHILMCNTFSLLKPMLSLGSLSQAERVSQLVMLTGIVTAAAKPKVCPMSIYCTGISFCHEC